MKLLIICLYRCKTRIKIKKNLSTLEGILHLKLKVWFCFWFSRFILILYFSIIVDIIVVARESLEHEAVSHDAKNARSYTSISPYVFMMC
jgi:hypothetical protein